MIVIKAYELAGLHALLAKLAPDETPTIRPNHKFDEMRTEMSYKTMTVLILDEADGAYHVTIEFH